MSGLETPDEESAPNTPQMSTMEHIDVLYTELQMVQGELDSVHEQQKGVNDEFILGGGFNEITTTYRSTTYWEDSYLNWELDEEASFTPSQLQPMTSPWARDTGPYLMAPTMCTVDILPPEILMYIFELCLEEDDRTGSLDDAAGFSGVGVRRVPLTLCHVCGYWRRLAMRTQSLWRSFSLTLEKAVLSVSGLRACMVLWSQGSGSGDMAINLEIDPMAVQVIDPGLMGQLADMLKHCHRLRVNVSDEIFSVILNGNLPRLRTLEVRTSYLRRDVQTFELCAPKLKTLAILGPTMCRFEEKSLPWEQLTEYRGVCWADVQRHLDIIRLCPNLEGCTLYPFYKRKNPGASFLPVQMKRLRHLHVASYLGTSLGGFLLCLGVPALRVLTLEIPTESPAYGHTGWPKAQILDLLERSDGELEKLELIGMDAGEEKLLEGSRFSRCETSVIVQPLL